MTERTSKSIISNVRKELQVLTVIKKKKFIMASNNYNGHVPWPWPAEAGQVRIQFIAVV